MEPRVFVRLAGPDAGLDRALEALERAGVGPVSVVLGDKGTDSVVEIVQPGTSATVESLCRRVEETLAASELTGFRIREYGAKPISLPRSRD